MTPCQHITPQSLVGVKCYKSCHIEPQVASLRGNRRGALWRMRHAVSADLVGKSFALNSFAWVTRRAPNRVQRMVYLVEVFQWFGVCCRAQLICGDRLLFSHSHKDEKGESNPRLERFGFCCSVFHTLLTEVPSMAALKGDCTSVTASLRAMCQTPALLAV